jgi:hypothetical protein
MRMARFIAPGGGLIVLADESYGYTGHALRASSTPVARRAQTSIISARSWSDGVFSPARILSSTALGSALPERVPRVIAQRQRSRLYGHSLSDMIALSTIATLATVEGNREARGVPIVLMTYIAALRHT